MFLKEDNFELGETKNKTSDRLFFACVGLVVSLAVGGVVYLAFVR